MTNEEFAKWHEADKIRRRKQQNKIILIVTTFLLGVLLMTVIAGGGDSEKEQKAELTPEQIRKEQISKLFSGWDGSHIELTKVIKKSMNDPDSYDHVETKYWDMKDHLVVQTTFRGNNAFGGKVKNSIKAKVDLKGNVLEIIE